MTWNDLNLGLYPFYASLYIASTNVFLYPADLLTTRFQNDKYSQNVRLKVLPVISSIVRREGISGT